MGRNIVINLKEVYHDESFIVRTGGRLSLNKGNVRILNLILVAIIFSFGLVTSAVSFNIHNPTNDSAVGIGKNVIFDISLNETTGGDIDDVDLYINGTLNKSEKNIRQPIINNLIFNVSGFSSGIYKWFLKIELKNKTIEYSQNYTLNVDNTTVVIVTNNSNLTVPNDNNYW